MAKKLANNQWETYTIEKRIPERKKKRIVMQWNANHKHRTTKTVDGDIDGTISESTILLKDF